MLIELYPSVQQTVDIFVSIYLRSNLNLQSHKIQRSNFRLVGFGLPYYLGIMFTLLFIVIQLLVMLASIRRNLLQTFTGDYSEIPPPKSSENASYVTDNFRFAGTLIGYVILAYAILGFFSVIIGLIIGSLLKNGSSIFVEDILKKIIPLLLLAYFKSYLNKILGQYVFLQNKINILSLNNRRMFMIFLYFNIFLDAFLGFMAAFTRLLRSTIGGILYMSRLDYSPLGRQLQASDPGFNAYCGFIYVERAHRHPILLYFISHLLRDSLYGNSLKDSSKSRRKWKLAVFLLNNPKIIDLRKRSSNLIDNELHVALIERIDRSDKNTTWLSHLRSRSNIGLELELDDIAVRTQC